VERDTRDSSVFINILQLSRVHLLSPLWFSYPNATSFFYSAAYSSRVNK